jgi:orotate phosphoribosyltransferase
MAEISASTFLELAAGRTGHFSMESGFHSALWLDLDALFASPVRVEPFVTTLADMLHPFRVDAVCGPLLGGAFLAQRLAQTLGVEFWYTAPASLADGPGLYRAQYRLPLAFANRLSRPRLALVDDVMSAGSSLRATYAELHPRTEVVAVGSLLQLGTVGADYFAERGIPVQAVVQQAFTMWLPIDCPQCAAGVPLESVVAPTA